MVDVFDEIVEDDFQIKAVDAMAVVLWAGTLRARPTTATFATLQISEKCLTDPFLSRQWRAIGGTRLIASSER